MIFQIIIIVLITVISYKKIGYKSILIYFIILIYPHNGHVFMYAGNNQVVEAMKTGTNIMVSDSPSRRKSIAIRRIVTGGTGEEFAMVAKFGN